MVMSVAPVIDQRKVEDCPASNVDGSAVKLLITGAAGGGGAIAVGAVSIGRARIKRAVIQSLEIEELTVGKLRVRELELEQEIRT